MKTFFDHLPIVHKAKMKLSPSHGESEMQNVPVGPAAAGLEQPPSTSPSPIQPQSLQASGGSMVTPTETPSLLSKFKKSRKAILKKLSTRHDEMRAIPPLPSSIDAQLPQASGASLITPSKTPTFLSKFKKSHNLILKRVSPRAGSGVRLMSPLPSPQLPMMTGSLLVTPTESRTFLSKLKQSRKAILKTFSPSRPHIVAKTMSSVHHHSTLPSINQPSSPQTAGQSTSTTTECRSTIPKFKLLSRKLVPKRKRYPIRRENISSPIPLSPSQVCEQSTTDVAVITKAKLLDKIRKLVPKKKRVPIRREEISTPIPLSPSQVSGQPVTADGNSSVILKFKLPSKIKKLIPKRKRTRILKENISNPIPLSPSELSAQLRAAEAESSRVGNKFKLINKMKKLLPKIKKPLPKRKRTRILKENISNPIPLSPSEFSAQLTATEAERLRVGHKYKIIDKIEKLLSKRKRKSVRTLKDSISHPIPLPSTQGSEWPVDTAAENPSFFRKLISKAKNRLSPSREEYEMQQVFSERAGAEQLGSTFSSRIRVPSPFVSQRWTTTTVDMPDPRRKRKHARIRGKKNPSRLVTRRRPIPRGNIQNRHRRPKYVRIRGQKIAYPIRLRSDQTSQRFIPTEARSRGFFRRFFRRLRRVESLEETISNPVQLLSVHGYGYPTIAARRKTGFVKKFKQIRKLTKNKPLPPLEWYELQDFSTQAPGGRVSAAFRSLVQRVSPRATEVSTKTAPRKSKFPPRLFGRLQKKTGSPYLEQHRHEGDDDQPDSTLNFGEDWEIDSIGEILTEVATGRPVSAPSVQNTRNSDWGYVFETRRTRSVFETVFEPIVRPATPALSDASERLTIVSTELSTDDSDLPPKHGKAECRRPDDVQAEDPDPDPTSFHVETTKNDAEDERDTQRAILSRQLRRSIIPMNALERRLAEEARDMMEAHLDRIEERREQQRQLNEERARAEELAEIEALSADLSNHPFALDALVGRDPITGQRGRRASFDDMLSARRNARPFDEAAADVSEIMSQHAEIEDLDNDHNDVDDDNPDHVENYADDEEDPFELEVLVGRDPDERGIRPEAPHANTSNVDQAMHPSARSETSSNESLQSSSSEECEDIAFNTPEDGEEWQVPTMFDLPALDSRLRMVARARAREDTLPAWLERWRRYRLRLTGTTCSHEVLLPYFVNEGLPDRACDLCGRVTRVLWSCASDTPDFSAYTPVDQPRRDVSILPQWMQRAIAAGEYTPEQVERLLDDKIRVIQITAMERWRLSMFVRIPSWENEEWLAQASAREVATVSPLEPCRLMQCGRCFGVGDDDERTRGCIDEIVHRPYQDPPRIPEYLSRPISVAAALQAGGH